MEPKEKSLHDLVKKLSERINQAEYFEPSERNEEWTKMALIVPLLAELGWDTGMDISYENSPDDTEERLDFILKCQRPIGIEAKKLSEPQPQNYDHPHIKKGLRQCKERGASYFIWTNGDYWQFFSLALLNAPFYQVSLKSGEVESISNQLQIIRKKDIIADPESFEKEIRRYWKTTALSTAWKVLLQEHATDLLELIRKVFPPELDITNEEIEKFNSEILTFLENSNPNDVKPPKGKNESPARQFPDDWDQLLDSIEPDYERARKRFRSGYYRKLGDYLISPMYKPWSKAATWKHVGVPNETSERKKLGPVVALFREWQFIEEAESNKYNRVEQSIPYLAKLLE